MFRINLEPVTGNPLYELSTYVHVYMFDHGMTYGLHVSPWASTFQNHVESHRLEKITDVLGYRASEGLTKFHLSGDIMIHREPCEVCMLLEVFYKVGVLWVIREEDILCTPRGELYTTSHYY